jgi:dolichyl-phosphate-mannose-protein mannosyltransferase
MEMKKLLLRAYHWEYIWLCLLVLVTLGMHFYIIDKPSELILDEQHYINDARNIITSHETLRPEHPPLGKLFIVAGIKVLGDNPWGWRIFPILFGTATIVLFYFLCRRLNMSRTAASIATFLLALENLTFLQASVAMLDVFYLTFMVAAFLLYASRRYINSGIAIGLGALSKLNGALGGPALVIHWIFTREGRSRWFLLTLIFAPLAFIELMIPFDLLIAQHFSAISDPLHRIIYMLQTSETLTFSTVNHPNMAHPWEWLINYNTMPYYITPHYTGAISFSIWALIIPTFAYMIYLSIQKNDAALFGAAWFTSTFVLWIPLILITNRVTYIYYFYQSVGAICMGLGIGLAKLLTIFQERTTGKLRWAALSIVLFYLAVHAASFVILSPVFPVTYDAFLARFVW